MVKYAAPSRPIATSSMKAPSIPVSSAAKRVPEHPNPAWLQLPVMCCPADGVGNVLPRLCTFLSYRGHREILLISRVGIAVTR